MFRTPLNEKIITIKLKRIELCDLILATTSLSHGENRTKWRILHDKLKEILDEFDEKQSQAE